MRLRAGEETRQLSDSVIFLTTMLHSLVLALVFAQEQINVVELRQTSAREAGAIADIFYDLDRYEAGGNRELRRALAEYVQTLIDEEWDLLEKAQLSQRCWDLWDEVFRGVLDLNPASAREESLRNRMLEDLDTISESRNIRSALYHNFGGKEGLFEAVFRELDAEIGERVGAAWDQRLPPLEAFQRCCRCYLDMALEPELQQIIFRDGPAVLGDLARQIDEASAIAPITEALRAMMDAHVLRPVDP